MNASDKRDRLIKAAADLFHHKGFVATSLADIAKDADIPIGNVYYYFKTKEELAVSAISQHKESCIERFMNINDTMLDPRERLIKSLSYYEEKIDDFMRYGCPIGKIVMDADMRDNAINQAAAEIFICFANWLKSQFTELGHEEQAMDYANSMIGRIEGAIILAKSLQNKEIIIKELENLKIFINNLPNKKINLGKLRKKD